MTKAIEIKNESLEKTIWILQRQFEDPDLTITELCEEAGISRQQYYRKLSEGQDIIVTLRKLIHKSKRIELANIAVSKHQILDQLVTRAMKSDDLDELVKAMKYLDEHQEDLQDDLGAKPGLEDEAQEFLRQGPKIKKQKSKFASVRVSKNQDGSVQVDIEGEEDIIEGDIKDIS